jgi:hypothetical protein
MATNATASPQATKPAKQAPPPQDDLVPPDEKFWQRYSPHHEFPLSNVASVALHILGLGLILLLARFVMEKPLHRPEVEAVRMNLGGGGGRPTGSDDGTRGGAAPKEVGAADQNQEPATDEKPQDLKLQAPQFVKKYDADAQRYFQRSTPNMVAFSQLNDNLRSRLNSGVAPKGGGGSGTGGGTGDGTGKGTGDGSGVGKARLTEREKRMLRWTMLFNTHDARDYLNQLNGLGAFLAIPIKEDADRGAIYQTVHDLTARPAMLQNEDLEQLGRIYWIESNGRSVAEIMTLLGLSIRPSHFAALFPRELESRLQQMELKAAGGRSEDDIKETRFRVKKVGDRYDVDLEKLSFHN